MRVSLIAAVAENGVIGKDNDLIWHLPADLKFFKDTTLGKPVIMGRLNYESIPEKYRPLPGRRNCVLSRNADYDPGEGAELYHDLTSCLKRLEEDGEQEVFIIGGGQIYSMALEQELVDRMYLTRVGMSPEGDTFFPDVDLDAWTSTLIGEHPADERHACPMRFERYDRD